jgi:uncharacterized protein HemX
MPIGETSGLPTSRVQSRSSEPQQADAPEGSVQRQQNAAAPSAAKSSSSLANHKGKLAIGAAAMLGLAVFYKWRDSKLAKEDPEEYARLRRLKAAVGTNESKPKKER